MSDARNRENRGGKIMEQSGGRKLRQKTLKRISSFEEGLQCVQRVTDTDDGFMTFSIKL